MYGGRIEKMTRDGVKRNSGVGGLLAIALLIGVVFCGLLLSGEMSGYVTEGIELAIKSVIPASLPFMIISDFYTHYGHPERIAFLKSIFTALTGLPAGALGAFICGNVGGFPIGAKMTAELYRTGGIDKRSAERLLALSSNPSCAFVIGGVGLGIYGKGEIGFILLISVYLSCALCALIARSSTGKMNFNHFIFEQKYNFVNSVKSAGISSVGIISFISCFSVAAGLVKKHVKNRYFSTLIIMLLEVTNAVKIFAVSENLSVPLKLTLTSFSLGFGGLSVMMQSSIFTDGSDLSMKKYLPIKLLQGVISGALTSLLYLLVFNR